MKRKFLLITITIAIPLILGGFLLSLKLKNELLVIYKNNRSIFVKDRNNENIFIKPNHLGYYASYSDEVPAEFKKLLIKKEDRYFYHHLGVNPVSSLRAFYNFSTGKENLASSTITQQLAKILLQNELDRNLKNKLTETIYAISLETHTSKEEILKMYVNSIYLGNKIQGIDNASRLYFESTPALLDKEQNLQILAALSSPSVYNPFLSNNDMMSKLLCEKLKEDCKEIKPFTKKEIIEKKEKFNNYIKSECYFELDSLRIKNLIII
jgi:membrane peptidoglycan carboxypeptidase